jgi:DNA-binding HxlR family transcriptional regulator
LIGNKWRMLIIRDLLDGTKRFNELKRSVGGISQKVLTENLRVLEENGLVIRTVYKEVPPRVEYSLTETGVSLEPVFTSIRDWGTEYLEKMNIEECN